MSVTTLRTRIKLLYKSYSEWQAIQSDFYPLAGEVCITHIPQASGPDVCMIKVGQWDGVEESASKKSYAELPFLFAQSADVEQWAKKETLDWSDISDDFKQEIIDLVDSKNTLYQIVSDGFYKWKLQKSEDNGETWEDATGNIDMSIAVSDLMTEINSEKTRATTAEETLRQQITNGLEEKPDMYVYGENGESMLWNEASGGGAKFTHNDGTESFVGVNDGGENGLVAQIYADKLVDGKWQGAKLDVSTNGIYYTVGNQSINQRMVDDNLLVVKKDIKDIAGGMHFIGVTEIAEGETLEQAIERLYTEKGKQYEDRKPGDIIIIKTADSDKEYIYDGEAWVELGDQGLYTTKAELEAEIEARSNEDAALQANIDEEEEARIAEDAKKVDKEIIASDGKAIIFNESDGGGAKFEHIDGTESFVGVNNGGEDGIAAQIYADKLVDGKWQGAKLDIKNDGIYYTVGNQSAAERDVEANKLAVQGDIDAEEAARIAGDEARMLEILPVSAYGFNTNLRVNQQVDGSALVDKVIEATNVDKKQVVIKSGDYKYNVISIVNDETLGVKGFCVETMSIPMTSLEDKPALEKGIFIYNPAIGKTCTFYDKDFTSAEIESYVGEIVSNLNSEVIRAKAAEQELQTNKLDVLPLVDDPDDPGYGWEYHIPYGFEFGATADTINITIKTLTLDNKFTKMNFTNTLPGATQATAGLMSASDKAKLDHFYARDLTQEEDDVLILNCNF